MGFGKCHAGPLGRFWKELGVGKILEKPWVVNGQIVIRPIATVSLSFDHRVIDGAVAARFLQEIKEKMEKPQSILNQ